jgi:hypothetical protein
MRMLGAVASQCVWCVLLCGHSDWLCDVGYVDGQVWSEALVSGDAAGYEHCHTISVYC